MKTKKDKILDALDGKNKVQSIYEDYIKIEKEITDGLAELPNFGQQCDCEDDYGSVKLIHSGTYEDSDEVHEYCLKCGGNVVGYY